MQLSCAGSATQDATGVGQAWTRGSTATVLMRRARWAAHAYLGCGSPHLSTDPC